MLCGVGDYSARLAREVARLQGLTVGVLTSTGGGNIEGSNVEVIAIVKAWRISDAPRIIGAICRWRPDVVHVQYPTLGYGKSWFPYFLPMLLKCTGFKVVQTWHEPPTRFRFFPNALPSDTLIGVEPEFLDRMRDRYARLVCRKRTHFIPIGSNIPAVDLTADERNVIREKYAGPARRLVVNFGFAYASKGLELLFKIADPERDTLVLMTALEPDRDDYHRKLVDEMEKSKWKGRVMITGFLESRQVAELLSAADAAVFPFRNGVGMRNGSFLASRNQGTFTITTSLERRGFIEAENVFYSRPDDVAAMKQALTEFIGRRRAPPTDLDNDWQSIALQHASIYEDVSAKAAALSGKAHP